MRFPEFTDEWTTINLGDIGYFKNGVNKSKNDFGSGYPFINLEDIFDKNAIYNNKYNLVKVSDKELQEYDLKKGDVLFVRSSVKLEGIGLTSVVMEDLKDTVYSGFIIRFREYNKTLDDNYKKYCFYVTSFRNNIISKSTTSANTNINQPSLKKMTLSIPSLKEQEKIANFLSKIDRKIKLLKNKKEEFIEFKHYLLQNLFPQNGGTAPKLRFKMNNEFKLSKYYVFNFDDLISEKSLKSEKNNQYPILSSTKEGLYTQEDYFNRQIASSDNTGYKILQRNQLVFSPQNLWMGNININDKYDIGIVSPSYKIYNVNKDVVLPQYLNI